MLLGEHGPVGIYLYTHFTVDIKSKIYIFYIISDKFNKIYLINNIVSRNKLIIIRNV